MTRAALIVLLLASTPARALDYGEFTEHLKTDDGRASVRAWLDGFGSGVGMYEVYQSMERKTRRFCPPKGTRLSPELLAGIVDAVVKEQPSLARPNIPVQSIIWVGLERQFPCKAPVTG